MKHAFNGFGAFLILYLFTRCKFVESDIAAVAISALCACTPPPSPAPMPPDATDAQPAPVSSDSCTAACQVMSTLGCPVAMAVCPANERKFEAAKEAKGPDGGAVRCADIATARSTKDLAALNIHCGSGQ